MPQEQEPHVGASTYEAMLEEQADELTTVRVPAGHPSLRAIEKRAAELSADEEYGRHPPRCTACSAALKDAGWKC